MRGWGCAEITCRRYSGWPIKKADSGAGITNHAAGRMDSFFLGNEFKKYRQKYRHFPVCPVCGEDETLSYDLTGNGP